MAVVTITKENFEAEVLHSTSQKECGKGDLIWETLLLRK